MRRRAKLLDPNAIKLAPGTRVVLQRRVDDAGGFLKPGTIGQVRGYDAEGRVEIETPPEPPPPALLGRVVTIRRASGSTSTHATHRSSPPSREPASQDPSSRDPSA